MPKKLPWLRLYRDIIQDDKIKLLAFEDRWHYIAFLCMKSDGLLDEPETDLKHRRIAVNLGVQLRESDEIKRRLREVGLIDVNGSPVKWDDLQYKSDSSAERVRKYREKQKLKDGKRNSNVTVTAQDTDTEEDTDTDKEKKVSKTRFSPPSVSDVFMYCQERRNTVDPEHFVNFYESKNWMIGKNKMKDWRAAVRTWEKRDTSKNAGLRNRSLADDLGDTSWAASKQEAIEDRSWADEKSTTN